MGIEPTISRFVVERLIHWANRALYSEYLSIFDVCSKMMENIIHNTQKSSFLYCFLQIITSFSLMNDVQAGLGAFIATISTFLLIQQSKHEHNTAAENYEGRKTSEPPPPSSDDQQALKNETRLSSRGLKAKAPILSYFPLFMQCLEDPASMVSTIYNVFNLGDCRRLPLRRYENVSAIPPPPLYARHLY